ncbi:MAG TPA: hypothetical protein VLQ80_07170 [Candidatus Saccharimonadia bacterium]|nr:hypothetical protein [Candidatus Saccharimonadia bacterium]
MPDVLYVVLQHDPSDHDTQCCAAFVTRREAETYAVEERQAYPEMHFTVRACPGVGTIRTLSPHQQP